MTHKELTEYNKECGEFLGWEYIDRDQYELAYANYGWWVKGTYNIHAEPRLNPNFKGFTYDFRFHSDWREIMRLIIMIEELGVDFFIKTRWNGFDLRNYTQVSVALSRGDLSHSRAIIYNTADLYKNSTDTFTDKKEAVVQAINHFLIWYNNESRSVKEVQ